MDKPEIHFNSSGPSGNIYAILNMFKDQFRKNNSMDPVIRALARALIGESLELVPDSQGRVSLTSELWERIGAKPGDEICIFDVLDKIEICTKSFYEGNRVDISELVGLDTKYYVEGL